MWWIRAATRDVARASSVPEVDRLIHEPARLRIMSILQGVDEVDFNFLLTALGLSKGNLSCHVDRLEQAGYVKVLKGFNGKIPHTRYRMTKTGRKALETYWQALDAIRQGD